eukprot:385224_1
MSTPVWLDTEQLPSVVTIDVTDTNISTILDYTTKQINVQYLTNFIHKHPKAEYSIEFKNTLNINNIKQSVIILSQLLSLICQFTARYPSIENDTNINIWDILFEQLIINIKNGKLWKINSISFSTNTPNNQMHYEHITQLYSNLIIQPIPTISITFELTHIWIDILISKQNIYFMLLRNAIIHSTNLG